jgi:hypothetical protein
MVVQMTVGRRELEPEESIDGSILGEFIRSGSPGPVSIKKENADGKGS